MEILRQMRRTWKAFIPEYLCGVALIVTSIYLNTTISYYLFASGLVIIGYIEADRRLTRFIFTPKKLVVLRGIIKRDTKNIYFHPLAFIPNIGVSQNRWQNLLNYGSICWKEGGHLFSLTDLNNPHKVLKYMEDMITKNRNV